MASSVTITNSGSITGGAAGIVGDSFAGDGIDGSTLTINNSGSITGGAANQGSHGAAIAGANLTIIDSGSIQGGQGGIGNTYAIVFTGGSNFLNLNNGTAVTLTGDIALDAGSVTFDQTGAVTLDNVITGTELAGNGSVIQNGTGELILGGANTYFGGTTISSGTLGVSNNSALGNGSLAMAAGTTLQAAASSLDLANAISLTGTDTFATSNNKLELDGAISEPARSAISPAGRCSSPAPIPTRAGPRSAAEQFSKLRATAVWRSQRHPDAGFVDQYRHAEIRGGNDAVRVLLRRADRRRRRVRK